MPNSIPAPLNRRFPKIKDWEITEQLSRSRWNDVYRASPGNNPRGNRGDYVLKIATEATDNDIAGKLLKREAQIGQAISHPNLVSVLDANFEHEPWFIVQPYISGVDLQVLLDCRSTVSIPFSLWIVRQIAQAVNALHEHQIIHCDISPRNVMLSGQGHVTLIDLGLVQVLDNEQLPVSHLAGSLNYLAPEQLDGVDHLTTAVDVYALGVLAVQLLADQLPSRHFNHFGDLRLVNRKAGKSTIDTKLDFEIAELLSSMLDRQPNNRPAISEVAAQLVRAEVNSFAQRIAA